MKQWYANSWGDWVLFAKSGQIALNVMGKWKGRWQQDRGAQGLEDTASPWLALVQGLGGISAWEKPSTRSPRKREEGVVGGRRGRTCVDTPGQVSS